MQEALWDGWSPALARSYVAHKLTQPPVVDGRICKHPWLSIPWSQDFLDIKGDAGPTPRFRTRAKMCWDDQHLYIAADMEEPHVWATLTQRDSVIFHDNDFEVFIDPDGDHCEYYELEINALNTVWDLRLPRPYRDGGTAINEWDIAGLRTAVHIDGTLNDPRDTDRGWSVEIAIPWKALAEFSTAPAPPRDGDQWRINFSRVQWQVTPLVVGGATASPEGEAVSEVETAQLPLREKLWHLEPPFPPGEGGRDSGRRRAGYQKVPATPEDNWVWSPQGVIDMHRPERWGYVQFTTAPPGTPVPFIPDPLADAKWYLQRVHEAQKLHHASAGAWAGDLAVLAVPSPAGVVAQSLSASAEGYELAVASAGRILTKDHTGRLGIR